MKKQAFLWGIFMLYIVTVAAQKQPCRFRLEISLYQNNQPLQHAEVFLEKNHHIEYTNEFGVVIFDNLCDTLVEIEIQTSNTHDHYTFNVSQNIPYQIFLKSTDSTGTVTIQAKRNTQFREPLAESKSIQSFAAAIQHLQNVQILTTGRTISKPILQGMIGLRAPIMIDGMRLQGQSWGLDHSPELGATGTEKISLLRGINAIAAGSDAWGGAISVENNHQFQPHEIDYTQKTSYQSNGGVFQINGIFQSGQSPSKKINTKNKKSNGTYIKYLGQISKDYQTPLGILENTASQEWMIAGGQTLHFKPGSLRFHASLYQFVSGIYLGSHIGNLTDLQTAISNNAPLRTTTEATYSIDKPKQLSQQLSFQGSWKSQRNQGLSIHLSYQQNLRQEFDPHRNKNYEFPQLDVQQQTSTVYLEKPFSLKKWSFDNQIGLSVQNQTFGGYYFIPEYQQFQQWGYIKFQHTPSKKGIQHEGIVRIDLSQRSGKHWFYSNDKGFDEQLFGFSGGYSFAWNSVKIDILQLWRMPGMNELYSKGVHHGSASYEQGNPNLLPESGQKVNFTYEKSTNWGTNDQKNGGNCKILFNGFSQYSQNFITLFPMMQPILTVRGAFPAFEYQQRPTFYSGAEIDVKIQKNINPKMRINAFSKANILYAKILTNNHFPPLIPCPTWINSFELSSEKWAISISHKYQFKQLFYTEGTDFAPPPNAFQLWGMSIKLPKFGQSKSFGLQISADNLFNVIYRDYLDRFRYFTPMPGRNIGIQFIYHLHHHHEHQD